MHFTRRSLFLFSPHFITALGASTTKPSIISLQAPHFELSPAETLRNLADDCDRLGIDKFDVYGDFSSSCNESFLRTFEAEVALEFQQDDAVFMPSGVMAQQIALLIHASSTQQEKKLLFACHHSSHLVLHEEDGYRELLGMEAVVIDTKQNIENNGLFISPIRACHVFETFEKIKKDRDVSIVGDILSTLIVEIPHREIGGKCTPFEDLLMIRELCSREGVRLHCDGARIFEATVGYSKAPAELAQLFDSIYISFYKGLGGISGAMLMGSCEFCDEARIWLRRFGGNLYTLLPYAVSGWNGYKRNWVWEGGTMTFLAKKEKLSRIVAQLTADSDINTIVTFDPPVPEVNMVHGYLRLNAKDFQLIKEKIENELGIRVLNRVRPAGEGQSKFEWTMGEANGSIPDEAFLRGWKALAAEINKK